MRTEIPRIRRALSHSEIGESTMSSPRFPCLFRATSSEWIASTYEITLRTNCTVKTVFLVFVIVLPAKASEQIEKNLAIWLVEIDKKVFMRVAIQPKGFRTLLYSEKNVFPNKIHSSHQTEFFTNKNRNLSTDSNTTVSFFILSSIFKTNNNHVSLRYCPLWCRHRR